MSDSTEQPIVLRATPGRDATASERARSRGEFRRQPHVATITIEAESPGAPVLAPATDVITPAEAGAATREVQYGRARMYH